MTAVATADVLEDSPVDSGKLFLPEELTPLSYTPSYGFLTPAQYAHHYGTVQRSRSPTPCGSPSSTSVRTL